MATYVQNLGRNLSKLYSDPCYAQGARCGHIEGRTGDGEELYELSLEAAAAQPGLDTHERGKWSCGYRHGFLLAMANQPLEAEIVNAPLPSTEAL